MQLNIQDSHIADAHELTSKGLRHLFKLELRDEGETVIRITPQSTVIYQGATWEEMPCKLSESAQNSTGEQSRPKFAGVNPEGVFSLFIQRGALDGAILTRMQVLLPDLEADEASYIRNIWVVSKVLSLNKQMFTLELRSILDGANFTIPARSFYPPAFPHVSLR